MAYTPADTTILNEVEARLGNITIANEYNNEFKRIKRAKMTPFKGFDLPACNVYHGTIDSNKTPYGNQSKKQFLIIEAHSKTRDDAFIDIADSLAADVVTGLYRKTSAPKVSDDVNISLDGLVKNLTYLGHDPFIGEGEKPFCGALVRFEIEYETNIGNMEILT